MVNWGDIQFYGELFQIESIKTQQRFSLGLATAASTLIRQFPA
jgi:hypothetical protein